MSAKNLKGVELGKDVMNELKNYQLGVVSEINKIAKKNSQELCAMIMAASPKDDGDYLRGWHVKEIPAKNPEEANSYIVHNATDYRLTHLLEYGHATKDGTGMVKEQPHIEPSRDAIEKRYVKDIEGAVKNYGK